MKVIFVFHLLLGTLFSVNRPGGGTPVSHLPLLAENCCTAQTDTEVVLSEGTVLFFDKRKGAGFIQPASSSKKIFVHASDTQERISAKQTVTYVVVKDKKGERAVQVQVKQP
ncbi:MAG: hypothetical protein EPGJADBJ_00312 [Saprospiraceae bacterium]|nr:hypothetical protein [Saprospiraceae bacterium]